MAVRQVVPGLFEVPLGIVNALILEADDGLILIDTGMPGSAGKILAAVRQIGRGPADIRRILVTHCHVDHAGSLAELKRLTGAAAAMHPEDAAMVRAGKAMRPLTPAPGLINGIIGRALLRSAQASYEGASVDHELRDGEVLPDAGGLRAVHAPGHCAGQLVFLWPQHGGVLIAADAAANVLGLGPSPVYEDLAEGERSLSRIAALEFEVACFGHGRPIRCGAAARFRRKWSPALQEPPHAA